MKKPHVIWILMVFLLSGCVISENKNSTIEATSNMTIEKDATLAIQMEDMEYARALQKLWNTAYPTHKDQLHIYVQMKSKTNTYDITWVSDAQAQKQKKQLRSIQAIQNSYDLAIPSHLHSTPKYFLPVEGKGLVFIYNEEELQRRKGKVKDLKQFETMKDLGEHTYYHNRSKEYVYPFLFTPHEESTRAWLKEDELYTNIKAYRTVAKELHFIDDQIEMDTFYKSGRYVCGLLQNDGSYTSSQLYKEGKLHFLKMPEYNGVLFAPIVNTYGFVVHKQTKYPQASYAFLQLVRSEKGIQALLDTTSKTPLISDADLTTYFVFDRTRKELMRAINGSQLSDVVLEENLKDSTIFGDIQNALYSKESNASFLNQIKQIVHTW